MKIIKEADIRHLLGQVSLGKISMSRMAEILNEKFNAIVNEAEKQMDFKGKMKFLRKTQGVSLQDLGDMIGNKITRQALHRYEKGEVDPNNNIKMLILTTLKK